MDIHHHSGHSPIGKGWKTYAWEFVMLFLAVFLAFLAEYRLEHKIEHYRENKYIRELHADLLLDIDMLRETIQYAEWITGGLDSLQQNLYHYSDRPGTDSVIYYQNFNYHRWIYPNFNENTISQLRYSGNFRLIRNEQVAEEIASYWNGVEIILKNAEDYVVNLDLSEDLMHQIFSRKYILEKRVNPYQQFPILISPGARLMTTDQHLLDRYANTIGRLTDIAMHWMVPFLKDQLIMAEKLHELICDEYHLEDEHHETVTGDGLRLNPEGSL